MKKICTLIICCFFVLNSTYGHGPGGHKKQPSLNDDELIAKAIKDVAIIVDKKETIDNETLDSSWKQLKEEDIQISLKKKGAVIVSFENKAKNKSLFVLLLDSGRYLSANFTGKFKGL